MSPKRKLFIILWSAGMVGVLSFLFVDLSQLIAHFPMPAGVEKPEITPLFKLLSVIQPAIILSISVLVGVALASKVGLSSPVAEALADGGQVKMALARQFIPGIVGGLVGGIAIVVIAMIWKPFLPPEVVTRIGELGKVLPIPTRLLYGGVTEELLLRWGLMTLLVWLPWRFLQKGQDIPKLAFIVGANVISSVIFGIGHLPIAFVFIPEGNLVLTAYVIIANSVFGFIAGYLYWKKGLESAMIAHMITHVLILTATFLGAYY
jgi:hypothetical protein